jgi:hypothetical protein
MPTTTSMASSLDPGRCVKFTAAFGAMLARGWLLAVREDARVGTKAKVNNVEIAYTPTNSSWFV